MNETTLNGQSMDIVADNIQKLKAIFPDVFTEGKVDFEKLEAVLGNYIEKDNERYNFTWHGKAQALRLAQTPSTGTLRPCKEESKDWDTTQNLYIEGDNLEVLKLLQKSYHNKVKMIYIDPPYNTGKDFVYPDNYKDNIQNYLEITGQVDGDGNRIGTNSEASGRYHTNWLNMMYPRLKIARNLLNDEGVIFISIDDNEANNLAKLCDEIFGEDNRISLICHKARASVSNDKIVSQNHNIILLYAKDIERIFTDRKYIGLDPDLSGFDLDDNDGKGKYKLSPVDGPGGAKKGNPYYEFLGVEGYFRFSKDTMQQKYEEGLVVKKGNSLYQKYYLTKAQLSRKTDTTWWDNAGLTSTATAKLKEMMGGVVFSNPKPLELIERMLSLFTFQDKEAIILDFFSGSATTAHAVMRYNSNDLGKRKFIMVQFPEILDLNDEGYSLGYKNICEIGKERIRRAGDEVNGGQSKSVDTGFKVLKLDSSNIKKWNPDYDNIEQTLYDHIDNFVEGRTELDIVFEIMLKYGIDLTMPIDEYDLAGKTVYSIGFGALIICLDQNIDLDIAHEITKLRDELQPEVCRVVFRDNGFKNDDIKTNVKENLKINHFDEIVSI